MTMTPEQAYNRLTAVYVQTTKNRDFTHQDIKQFANNYYGWAEANIRHQRWTYRHAEDMVNICRGLSWLAMQHQP